MTQFRDKPDRLIRPAAFPADLDAVRTLFREYAAWLDIDFCFQGFEAELAALPGYYAPPRGELLLAFESSSVDPIGCVALRPMADADLCEMKRLYVRESARGTGLGRTLAHSIVDTARNKGYRAMRLDTLGKLIPAITLYRSMGFKEIPAYYDNPIPGVVYLELAL
ncbi:MAG: GNAT family N-acetyltransferase [Phycisphaerae bacterium]